MREDRKNPARQAADAVTQRALAHAAQLALEEQRKAQERRRLQREATRFLERAQRRLLEERGRRALSVTLENRKLALQRGQRRGEWAHWPEDLRSLGARRKPSNVRRSAPK